MRVVVVRVVRTLRLQPEVVEAAVVLARAALALARLLARVDCLQVLAPALTFKVFRVLPEETRITHGQAAAVAAGQSVFQQVVLLVDRFGAAAAVVLVVIAPQLPPPPPLFRVAATAPLLIAAVLLAAAHRVFPAPFQLRVATAHRATASAAAQAVVAVVRR